MLYIFIFSINKFTGMIEQDSFLLYPLMMSDISNRELQRQTSNTIGLEQQPNKIILDLKIQLLQGDGDSCYQTIYEQKKCFVIFFIVLKNSLLMNETETTFQ